MKIGIVTTHWALNYGAVLQSYALEKYLQSQGYDCEIIDFRPRIGKYGRNYIIWNKSIKQVCQNIIKILNMRNRKLFQEKVKAFNRFVEKELDKSFQKFYTVDDMENISGYDVLICGSDQIWNLNLYDMPVFFLPYKDKLNKTKFISYAASIAENLNMEQWKVIMDRTKHFDAISIREGEATEQYNKYRPGTAMTVLDPVFLLSKNEWEKKISQNKFEDKNSYILCYFIGYRGFEYDLVKRIKDIYGVKIVNVGQDPTNHLCADIQLSNVSPFEFVSLIRDARYIVTNSFHMTAFSTIFEKDFLIVKHQSRNSRMENLLNMFSINDRFIESKTQIDKLAEKDFVCDYSQISEKMRNYIALSKEYLRKSLEGDV